MEREHYIGLDVHCKETEIAVITAAGRLTRRMRVPTTIPALVDALNSVRRPRHVVLEEGALADWLIRNLAGHVEKIVACDPRRNHLIAKDADKDDPIDAEKLGHLYRGGYIKPVHHPETFDRAVFKQQVGLYHDRVRNRVRQANRIMAQLRRHGLIVHESAFAEPELQGEMLSHLPHNKIVHAQLKCLWNGYDMASEQVKAMRQILIQLARKEPQIRRFVEIPGVHWIRASTFFAYIDTPWRFRSKSALWKYLGIGLERRTSGGGPVQLHMARQVNRCLKTTILGAATSAIASRDNPFAEQYRRWVYEGLSPRIARRNVARSQASVMWGMSKNGNAYRPEWVGLAAASSSPPRS